MTKQKYSLSWLEGFPRDSSEFREYIFGMLFLQRLSDIFDDDDRAKRKSALAKKGRTTAQIADDLEKPNFYGYYVPEKARWKNVLSTTMMAYMADYQLGFLHWLENLFEKYTVKINAMIEDREKESARLSVFLKELGYE